MPLTHTRLTALFQDYLGKPVPERKKPIWILLKQETVSGSGISWVVCKLHSFQTDNHASNPELSVLQSGWQKKTKIQPNIFKLPPWS